ncbi:MAG: ABC transporter ATP-binding protein, partial [Rhizobium giardinii]
KSGKVVERLSSGDLVAGRISEAYTKNLMVASKGFVRKAALA